MQEAEKRKPGTVAKLFSSHPPHGNRIIKTQRNIDDLQMYDGEAHQHLYSLPLYLRNSIKEETRVISEESPLFVF